MAEESLSADEFAHDSLTERRDLRILIVDDNYDAATTMSMLLEIDGHRTCTACNGSEAIRAAERERYDVVLLDLDMPIMDGYEAARALARLQSVPILIACTADDGLDARRRTAALGFSAHLGKPFPLETLKELLRRQCGASTDSGLRQTCR